MRISSIIRSFSLTLVLVVPAAADVVTVGAAKDNTLCEDSGGALSNGSGEYFFVGRTDNGRRRRGLVGFDLSAIPAGATINSVSLELTMSKTKAGNEPIELRRVNVNWGQGASDANNEEGRCTTATAGDATWTHAVSPASSWTSAGGDFSPTASATTSVGGNGPYTWASAQMVTDVQLWVDNPGQSHGWLVLGNEAVNTTAKRFNSRENQGGSGFPRLTVDYTVGAAAPNVYEHNLPGPCAIVVLANSIGMGLSPLPLTPPGTAMLEFYQVDFDGDCMTAGPNRLEMVKGPAGLVFHF